VDLARERGGPEPERDRRSGRGDGESRDGGEGVRAEPPAERDDGGGLAGAARLREQPRAQLRRRGRGGDRIGERSGCLPQRRELLLADGAAAEVGLEDAALLVVERVQDIAGCELVDVVLRHGHAQRPCGVTSSAASAYQTPNSRLATPSAGARRAKERRSGAVPSAR